MRNLLLAGTAALILGISAGAAFAEPNENPLTNTPHGPTWQGDAVTGSVFQEGRSAYIVNDQDAGPSASYLNRQPRS